MFNKLKAKKPSLSLNSVSNAIKNSNSANLAPQIDQKSLVLSLASQYGIKNHSILAMEVDPVQSLLAISTTNNAVHVFGQNTVEVVFEFNSPSPIVQLRFVKGVYLVALASTSSITVLSLHSKAILGTFAPPGSVSVISADPSLDWLIIGLANGQIVFYDVDRLNLTPTRIDNLQKKVLPKEKLSPVVDIEWHPRDIGSILVTYSHCAILYSLTSEDIKTAFVYAIAKGAKGFDHSLAISSGGKKKLFGSPKEIIVEAVESHFHPNGLHVVTVHKDNTLAFWDANDGTLLEARSLTDTGLNQPGTPLVPVTNFFPIANVKWVCGEDPELTQLIIAGGDADNVNAVHILDFGLTLKYSITSHEKQGAFYASPSMGQKIIPVSFNQNETGESEYIARILPMPTDPRPYFAGGHNPAYLLLRTNLGSFHIVPYSGNGGSLPNFDLGKVLLPPSLAFIHPPSSFIEVVNVRRMDWYSVQSNRVASGVQAKSEIFLKGGAGVSSNSIKSIGNTEALKTILVTGHEAGVVRLLDITKGEVNETEGLIQISLIETLLPDVYNNKVVAVSCAFEGRDLSIGMASGDVVLCKFGKLPTVAGRGASGTYSDCPVQHSNGNAKIISLKDRIRGSFALSSTFLPMYLLQVDAKEEISVLKTCNIGFTAIAYKSGRLVVCDVGRGPAIIFNCESLQGFVPSSSENLYITSMEFALMEYGQDGYSSILLIAGTNGGGNLLYFKILPLPNGGFEVAFADKTIGLSYRSSDKAEQAIHRIIPVNANAGHPATPTAEIFAKLGQGALIPGYIVTISTRDIRVIKPPKQKLSHKVVDDAFYAANTINVQGKGVAMACITSTGYLKICSIPALQDLADIKFSKDIISKFSKGQDQKSLSQSMILFTGEMIFRYGQSEMFSVIPSIKESKLRSSAVHETDLLFNENAIIPPRPVVSALQWAKGSSVISSADLASLIAGPNRKPAKHPESQLAYNISPEANPNQNYGGYGGETQQSGKDYKEPVRRGQAAGRYNLGGNGFMRSLQSGIESVEESINGYANAMSEAVNESVEGQKRDIYASAFKSKFGF